ncbi:MAG TPA: radical SAM protein [Desulfobacterales bacterium]
MKKTVAFARDTANVFFHILTQCNLQCRHCYINPRQHGSGRLPLDTIQRWLALFAGRVPRANLVLLGGEPTLHPDLPAIVRAARSYDYASVTIDSNGYLFHDILNRVSPEEVDYFSFSLDGATAPVNDEIRGTGSYDACVRGIQQAVAAGFNTSLIYTVSRANLEELPQMEDLLLQLGIQRFFIQVIGIRGKSAETGAATLQVSPSEWLRVVPPAAEKIARRGLTVTYPKVFLEPETAFECAGKVAENYFIFPNGRVYRCPLCEDFPVHSLKIENDRLVEQPPINERDLFQLDIPEGCVMNKLIQPDNITYCDDGTPQHRIACCLLKEEIS